MPKPKYVPEEVAVQSAMERYRARADRIFTQQPHELDYWVAETGIDVYDDLVEMYAERLFNTYGISYNDWEYCGEYDDDYREAGV